MCVWRHCRSVCWCAIDIEVVLIWCSYTYVYTREMCVAIMMKLFVSKVQCGPVYWYARIHYNYNDSIWKKTTMSWNQYKVAFQLLLLWNILIGSCVTNHWGIFHIRNIGQIRNLLSYNACSTIIHALISCRLDYCNSLLYNVPTHKIDRLQRLQNQCARILTKSQRREHITPVLKSLHWLKIQDRITYKILMLTYKSYYNIAPTYLCELISRRDSSVNTRLGADHHQLIMPPISKDCSNTFLERSFIYAAPCEWNKLS